MTTNTSDVHMALVKGALVDGEPVCGVCCGRTKNVPVPTLTYVISGSVCSVCNLRVVTKSGVWERRTGIKAMAWAVARKGI